MLIKLVVNLFIHIIWCAYEHLECQSFIYIYMKKI